MLLLTELNLFYTNFLGPSCEYCDYFFESIFPIITLLLRINAYIQCLSIALSSDGDDRYCLLKR